MNDNTKESGSDRRTRRAAGFTLVELLTVVFIISLLIGILIPSINGARTQAKKTTTKNILRTIDTALEMFRNENERDFRQTNGYPPSFAHPPVPGYKFDAYLGQFPFLPDVSKSDPPTVYGAQWLPAMLMGVDGLGYVSRRNVPHTNNLHREPWRWYEVNPLKNGKQLERQQLYLDPEKLRTVRARKLIGRPPGSGTGFFSDPESLELPVILDSFEQPILYYVAGSNGRTTNMLHDERRQDNDYELEAEQQRGVPFYFHQDNEGFTGTDKERGWDFGGRLRPHLIARSGAELTAVQLTERNEDPLKDNFFTFARYIMDRTVFTNILESQQENTPVPPVHRDGYLLITAGPDGIFGTNDDVSNLPPWPDN